MITDVKPILKQLNITETGHYDDNMFIIPLANSNEYAKMYTKLEENAVNTENPNFGTNTNNTTVKITNYFEVTVDNVDYNLFLIADFEKDSYYLKIAEK